MTDSIKDRLPRLVVMIEDCCPQWNPSDPYRFARKAIQQSAWAALDNGMRLAAQILETGEAFGRATAESQANPEANAK